MLSGIVEHTARRTDAACSLKNKDVDMIRKRAEVQHIVSKLRLCAHFQYFISFKIQLRHIIAILQCPLWVVVYIFVCAPDFIHTSAPAAPWCANDLILIFVCLDKDFRVF